MTENTSHTSNNARPHMVMVVANRVIGDSRVEKSALSARRAGYQVTVMGVSHRSAPPLAQYQGIPIWRVPMPVHRFSAQLQAASLRPSLTPDWSSLLPSTPAGGSGDPSATATQDAAELIAEQDTDEGADEDTGASAEMIDSSGPRRMRQAPLERLVRPLTRTRGQRLRRWARRADERMAGLETAGRSRLGRLHRSSQESWEQLREQTLLSTPGGWRELCWVLADYEDNFLRALIAMEPDIIHVHDRHALPAADSYAQLMASHGVKVPWIYDAHEWVPGQHIAGPEFVHEAWIAAESELTPRADGVISVTEDLADQMQQRHGLSARPSVAVNAPEIVQVPMDPAVRRPLREECGLDPDTPLLTYVGRMTELRGVFVVIDALAHLPGVHVGFVGQEAPQLRAQMVAHAQELGVQDRLHLFDYVPSASVTWYIDSADIGLSPLMDNEAHRRAVPTKLSEYIHAGLPVVASDLEQQTRFVRGHDVGEVFVPGDALSLANAVRTVLEDLDAYKERAREPEFQARQSWTSSERSMTDLWHSLCPATPLQPTGAGPFADVSTGAQTRERGPVLAVVGPEEAVPHPGAPGLEAAWRTDRAHGGDVLSVPAVPAPEPAQAADDAGLPPADPLLPAPLTRTLLDRWMQVDRRSDAVLYRGTQPAFAHLERGFLGELETLLLRGRPVAVLEETTPLATPEEILLAMPQHAFSAWTQEQRDRYTRQIRWPSKPLRGAIALGVQVLTPSALVAAAVEGAHWLPVVVPVPEQLPERPGQQRALRVMIASGVRTAGEEAAVTELSQTLTDQGVEVLRTTRRHPLTPQTAATVDLLVEPLAAGEYGPAAPWAWAHGAVVVGGASQPASAAAPAGPGIVTEVESLVSTVQRLLGASETELGALREQGWDYVRRHHDGRAAVQALRGALGLD